MLRKLLNIPTKTQSLKIREDVQGIMDSCDRIASTEFHEQKENQLAHDTRCPRCRERDVVDKINNTTGIGKTTGNFYLGFGNINGRVDIKTEAVNHCSECGHEWEKFKIKYVSKTEIIRIILNYLGLYLDNPEREKRFSWKMEAIEVFKDRTAESICFLRKKHRNYLHTTPRNKLILRKLRRNYISVFKSNK